MTIASQTSLDKVVLALLRTELAFFIRKVSDARSLFRQL